MANDSMTLCFVNGTSEEEQEKLNQKVTSIFKLYYGFLTIPFAGAGLIMSGLFILAVIKAVKQRKVSRKCYVLIINRSVGDVLSCLTAFANVAYVLLKTEPNQDMAHLFDIFFIASFWSGMISYVSLSILKLYAVARPFNYRNSITMKRCIYLCAASWLIFFIVLVYALGATAFTKIPFLREWSGCKLETCLRKMYRVRNFIAVIIYFFTILCFALTGIKFFIAEI